MKTKIIICLAIFSISFSTYAQYSVGVLGGVQIPLSDFGKLYKNGNGFTLSAKYTMTENLKDGTKKGDVFGLNIGVANFSGKDYDISYKIIPITLFTEGYYGKGKLQFLYGYELGASICSQEGEMMGTKMQTKSKTYFLGGIYAGLIYKVSNKIDITSHVKYFYQLDLGKFESGNSFLPINLGVYYNIN